MSDVSSELPPLPRAWFDLDGTMIQIIGGIRNLIKSSKTPLMEGVSDFALGVREGGVAIDGILTRRWRRGRSRVTKGTIRRHGINDMLNGPETQLHMVRDEKRKGRFLVEQSLERPIAMVEDRPHRLVPSIMGALSAQETLSDKKRYPITIGVVASSYAEEVATNLAGLIPDLLVPGIEQRHTGERSFVLEGIDEASGRFPGIHVVMLDEYSRQAGHEFAMAVHTNSAPSQ